MTRWAPGCETGPGRLSPRAVADSLSTWAMIRLDRQPIAFRMPNSRARRLTAAGVSRLAAANAAASTGTFR